MKSKEALFKKFKQFYELDLELHTLEQKLTKFYFNLRDPELGLSEDEILQSPEFIGFCDGLQRLNNKYDPKMHRTVESSDLETMAQGIKQVFAVMGGKSDEINKEILETLDAGLYASRYVKSYEDGFKISL